LWSADCHLARLTEHDVLGRESLEEVMAPGALDPLTKEMLYVAISSSNGNAHGKRPFCATFNTKND
jgi:hypothetical protein